MQGFRAPNERELTRELPMASRGWESTTEERSGWVQGTAIDGEVPLGVRGTYLRNGPGLTEVFGQRLHHPIDGDGMVVALTFVDGKVHLKNKFVQTKSHREEAAAKRMLYNGNMGSRVPGGAERPLEMRDPAHTNAFIWGGKLLACYEYALPHTLDPRTLETLGPDSLNGKLKKIKAFSAHFRLDVAKDLLVGIGFKAGGLGRKSKLAIFEFDRKWDTVQEAILQIDGLNYAHDFLMTPDYYIFHMTPFVDVGAEAVEKIIKGEKAPGELMEYTPGLPSCMVVVDRYLQPGQTERRVMRLDTDPCHIYHFQNAVQHGEQAITFGATCLPPGFKMTWGHDVGLSNVSEAPGVYHLFKIDLAQQKCERTTSTKLRYVSNEFPTANPYRQTVKVGTGRQAGANQVLPARYVYLMAAEEGTTIPYRNIVKYDPHGDCVSVWKSPGVVGEPVFVPRHGHASAFFGDDDDGWLITQCYYPEQHKMVFVILDAKDLSKGPICSINPGFHIPYSFHGSWSEDIYETAPPKL